MTSAEQRLERISYLTARAQGAQRQLKAAVAEAVAADDDVTAIARAADVGRQTVYRWAKDHSGTGGGVRTATALSEALAILAAVVGPTNQATIATRVTHPDIPVKILGIEIGIKSLPDQSQLTEEERSIISTGAEVAAKARQIHTERGTWPEWVTIGAARPRPEAVPHEGDDVSASAP